MNHLKETEDGEILISISLASLIIILDIKAARHNEVMQSEMSSNS